MYVEFLLLIYVVDRIWLQVGSADHHIHYFDVRNSHMPLYVFNGHRKAVSYVKFLSSNELASASTDSTLRLWDVKENCPVCCINYPLIIMFDCRITICRLYLVY